MMIREGWLGAWMALAVSACGATELDLNGSWAFRFAEDTAIEAAGDAAFTATDTMIVPGCYDAMPKWQWKRGTGLYRRTFTLEKPVENAWLVVEGMGLRGAFEIDGRKLGTHPYPYARLELPVGALAAGEHTLFAAIENRLDWSVTKLAQVFYDFYFYGGFYRSVKLSFDNRRLFVRTRDYTTGTVEVEAVNFAEKDFAAELLFDGRTAVPVTFRNARATARVPAFRLWSPEAPNLHTVSVRGVTARFGVREIKAAQGKLWLNGKTLFLKGVNRHEQCQEFGVTIGEAQMLRDLQILKSLNANFIRGAHYQQSQRFLDLCDEVGLLVWEESLGWGNGKHAKNPKMPDEFKDAEFCDLQVHQTREMVRASFNHPSVIIFGFLNEPSGNRPECKALVDRLVAAIKAEDSGRLTTFACDGWRDDISHANTDLVSVNSYPGTIPSNPGSPAVLRQKVADCFNGAAARFRKLYPDKPIIVSECGVGAFYGYHDPGCAVGSEEFQEEYIRDILDTVWNNPDLSGYAIWQFTDTNTHRRNCGDKAGRLFGISIAGIVDFQRRPKKAFETVKQYFGRK